jgi:hypothetical protein
VVSLFKDRSAATVVWVLILSVVVHSHFFYFPPQVVSNGDDGLISLLFRRFLVGLNPLVVIALYHAVVLVQALRLNFLFTDQRMFTRANFLTAMVYVLMTAVFKEWNNLSPALVANTFVIWLFAKTVRLYNNPNPKSLLFNIGLVIGLCVLLYHPTALLIIVAMFALMVVRPFNITEWVVMLMGILSPYYFLGAYLFLTDQFTNLGRFTPNWQLNLPDVSTPAMFFISLGVILIMLLTGLYYYQTKSRRMLIHIRKNWGVLIVMLWVMIPLPFINENAGLDTLLMWSIPVSPFIAVGFLEIKKPVMANFLFWIFVILIGLNNWAYHLGLIKN